MGILTEEADAGLPALGLERANAGGNGEVPQGWLGCRRPSEGSWELALSSRWALTGKPTYRLET